MISRADFDAYGRAVSAITDAASEECERQVMTWCRAHPDATVAEAREAAREIMDGLAQVYDEASASLAAEWYDAQASAAGARLPEAVTVTTYSPEQVERVARYQAAKLVAGDVEGFARACGEYLENGVRRSLNETVLANARRDRKSGVRFARVPTGSETCTFCVMLASRGAVYESRKTAGEFDHYHRRCDCKVVPGFEDDKFAEVVEGYDCRAYYDLWKKHEKLDASGMPQRQIKAVKAAWADAMLPANGGHMEPERLADLFDDGMGSAVSAFRKDRTMEGYERTVGRFLEEVGRAYGVELSGEHYVNRKHRVVGAAPDGDEIWVITRLGRGGQFIYATHENKSPDFRDGEWLLEIKTPKSERKLNNLLVEASSKFATYPEREKRAILSLLRLPDSGDAARDAASRFVDDGTFDEVLVLTREGFVS
ncbi:MAG: hypothetical protein Q4B91_03475 [Atopobiaceae bacterium]|nr:hypothetical protein [Atopobiaceae bacterium]